MKSGPGFAPALFVCCSFVYVTAAQIGRVLMRIILILIVIAAVFVVVQAHRHGCKYDATLISCVMGKSGGEAPAGGGETSQPAPAPETPAPAAPPPAEPAPATPPAQ
jgi:hypothetical protein